MPQLAVLTGDLVQSTRADAAATEAAMTALSQGAHEIAAWIGTSTRFTRSRGDGWQIVLPLRRELALRAAICLIARLKARRQGLATRIALGLGPYETLGSQDLSDAHGAAFTLSGRALDGMKSGLLRLSFPAMRPLHQGFVDLLEPLLWRWTPEQAEAVALSLHPEGRSQKDIARLLHISEQAVSLRLKGAHDHPLRQALKNWEADLLQAE